MELYLPHNIPYLDTMLARKILDKNHEIDGLRDVRMSLQDMHAYITCHLIW